MINITIMIIIYYKLKSLQVGVRFNTS